MILIWSLYDLSLIDTSPRSWKKSSPTGKPQIAPRAAGRTCLGTVSSCCWWASLCASDLEPWSPRDGWKLPTTGARFSLIFSGDRYLWMAEKIGPYGSFLFLKRCFEEFSGCFIDVVWTCEIRRERHITPSTWMVGKALVLPAVSDTGNICPFGSMCGFCG